MSADPWEFEQLMGEHQTLIRGYGQAQARCSSLIRQQAAEIERLEGELMRLRATMMMRDTALFWMQADYVVLEAAPGVSWREAWARRLKEGLARLQEAMRKRSALPHGA
ncbi:hypothetical protein [Pseudogulbenkiania sp. MAI-1]|uniref:hypothetical protein n=1 Tax=Pseudogulbenkiania sp. MAI-1 TaxID=990370 RepID=UPI00045EBE45|nr:hypothetical protein [Pseudogulbenkiania sp. MAI-1]